MTSYPFPWGRFLGLAMNLSTGHRSLLADCASMVARITPSPLLHGEQNIPDSGPVVLMANHYQRAGLWIAWPGAVITEAVARRRAADPPVHWLVTGGLHFSQSRGRGPQVPLARPLLEAVARCYHMEALPPRGSLGRAAAIHRWLGWATEGDALGMFPEGIRGRAGRLRQPEPGFDHLTRFLAKRAIPVLPVGICELAGAIHVAFGDPILGSAYVPDRSPAEVVMRAIALLLPEAMRGPYSTDATPVTRNVP